MSKLAKIIVGAAVVVVILGVGLWWFVWDRDNPEEVSIRAATNQLEADLELEADLDVDADLPTTTEPSTNSEPGAAPEITDHDFDVNGTWIVDDEFGSFDFDTASGSFAGFRVDEVLTVGEVVAVGRTGGVTGTLTIKDNILTATEVTVDMTSIVSDDSRRERAIRGAVDASRFSEATFVLTQPVALPDSVAAGTEFSIEATGDLSVKGTTKQVVVAIDAVVRGDGIGVVVGTTEIVWEDFGVTPPSAPIVVSVQPSGVLEFQLILNKEQTP